MTVSIANAWQYTFDSYNSSARWLTLTKKCTEDSSEGCHFAAFQKCIEQYVLLVKHKTQWQG